jgi:hypothetical protein
MIISAFQVDNVIKAYNKQNNVRIHGETPLTIPVKTTTADSVTLSGKAIRNSVYQKISYTLIDLLKK